MRYSSFRLKTLFLLVGFLLLRNLLWAQTLDSNKFQELEQYNYPNSDHQFRRLKQQYDAAVRQENVTEQASCLEQMGKICYRFGHLSQALDFYQQARSLLTTENKEIAMEAMLCNDLGQLYYRMRDPTACKAQHDRALSLFTQLKNSDGIAETYGFIGHYYEKQHKYDSALYFQNRALAQYSHTNNIKGIADIQENLGSIYEDLQQYDKARLLFEEVVRLYTQKGDRNAAVESINNLGDVYRKMGNYAASLPYSREALRIGMQTGNIYEQAAAYKDLGEVFNLMGRNDSAFHYMKRSRKALLDIYSAQNSQQTNLLRILYETGKKDKAIETMRKNRIIYLAGGIVALLVIALLVAIISRQKLKINQAQAISERNTERNRIQQEQIAQKTRELANHTLNVIQRNQFLEELHNTLADMVKEDKRDQKKQMQQLVQKINQHTNYEKQWQEFNHIFEQVHPSFFEKLGERFPDLTTNDIKLLALLKLKMDSKDMAVILGISVDSLRVSRYRLRKKMALPEGINLSNYLQDF